MPIFSRITTMFSFFPYPEPDYISVQSLDFDGCIFNSYYQKNVGVIASNTRLWEFIQKNTRHAGKVICMVGSSRQTKEIDVRGIKENNTSSCFHAVRDIHHHLKTLLRNIPCYIDEYLLADLYGDRTAGYNFEKSIEEYAGEDYNYKNADHFVYDESKLSLIYAQTHKIASEHPDKKIEFTFYDDRPDILYGLKNFYKSHPELLPRNTTLMLRHYAGDEIILMPEIDGTGPIDYHYQQNIEHMALLATKQIELFDEKHKICSYIERRSWNFVNELKDKNYEYFVNGRNKNLDANLTPAAA